MNRSLAVEITMEEVHAAVFQMGSLKITGPHDLNGHFYQQNWESTKMDIFEEVSKFCITGYLNPELKKTHVSLVPKVKNPESLE